jgi:hypothetical protein
MVLQAQVGFLVNARKILILTDVLEREYCGQNTKNRTNFSRNHSRLRTLTMSQLTKTRPYGANRFPVGGR